MASRTPTADRVIRVALSQVGYREGRDRDGNWNNHQKYSPAVPGLEWSQNQAWCATFISWVALIAKVAKLFPRTASTDAAAKWYQDKGRWSEYPAIAAQGFLAHGYDEFHTFLVVKYDDTYIWTVEGNTNNTGSPQGNGVYELKRRRRDTAVEGYGYPDYPEGIVSADPAWKHRGPKENTVKKAKPKKNRLGVSWNLRTHRNAGQAGREAKALLRANGKPPFAAFQEGVRYRAVLTTLAALYGYRKYQPRNKGKKAKGIVVRESGSTVLFVKRNVEVREHGAIRCQTPWRGPNGAMHEGRVLPWAVAKIRGKWTLLISIHAPTGRNTTANRKAWNETMREIEKLIRAKGLPFIAVGDWNCAYGRTDDRSPHHLAKVTGSKIVHTDTPIDYALTDGQKFKLTKGAKRGSDHHAVRLVED